MGKSYRVLNHNLLRRLQANIATETNEKTDGNKISSITSIFSDMKAVMDDFRQGLPDYIEKIISKKLDAQDAISLHAKPTNIDEDSGSIELKIMGIQIPQSKIKGTKIPIMQMKIKVLQ